MEVFVAILLVILALLAVRIGVAVEYTDSLLVRLKIFGFKIRLYPRKKAKKKSGKSSGSAQNSGTVKNKKEKKAGIHEFLEIISTLLEAMKDVSGIVRRRLIIREIKVAVSVADEDASQTAVRYGEICAAVYPAMACITSFFKTKDYEIDIRPDFAGNNTRVNASADVYMRVVFIIGLAVSLLFKYIKIMTNKDNKKAVFSNGNASNQ